MDRRARKISRRFLQRGFTLLELAVVVTIISFLMVVAIEKIWALRTEAERAAVAQVVGALRSALGLEVARRFVREGLDSIPELVDSNPMELLAQRPAGYQGEVENADPSAFGGGEWFFDPMAGILTYMVRFQGSFDTELMPARLRFRVALRYRDLNGSGTYEEGVDDISGLDLEPVIASPLS